MVTALRHPEVLLGPDRPAWDVVLLRPMLSLHDSSQHAACHWAECGTLGRYHSGCCGGPVTIAAPRLPDRGARC